MPTDFEAPGNSALISGANQKDELEDQRAGVSATTFTSCRTDGDIVDLSPIFGDANPYSVEAENRLVSVTRISGDLGLFRDLAGCSGFLRTFAAFS